MFCQKCGTQNRENGNFCIGCGASLVGAESNQPMNSNVQPTVGYNQTQQQAMSQTTVKTTKKNNKKLFIIIVSVLLVLSAAIIGVFLFNSFGSDEMSDDLDSYEVSSESSSDVTESDDDTSIDETIGELTALINLTHPMITDFSQDVSQYDNILENIDNIDIGCGTGINSQRKYNDNIYMIFGDVVEDNEYLSYISCYTGEFCGVTVGEDNISMVIDDLGEPASHEVYEGGDGFLYYYYYQNDNGRLWIYTDKENGVIDAIVFIIDESIAENESEQDQSTDNDASISNSLSVFSVGCIGPTTGNYAIYGSSVVEGAQLAIDEINALGGDIQFELLVENDSGDSEKSVIAYYSLEDQGMQVLLGTVTSGACISVAAETYADGMFQLTPSASSDLVIEGNDNVFQVCYSDDNQGAAAADYIASEDLGTTVAIIYQSDLDYSKGIYNTFIDQAKVLGLDIVYVGAFTEDTNTDFSVQISQAKASGADLVFLPIYYFYGASIIEQSYQNGYSPIFFGVDGLDGILTVDGFDASLAEDVYIMTAFAADATDSATVIFVENYEATYGTTPNQFAADGYDTVYILYELIQESGATADMTYEELNVLLQAAILEIEFDGLTGANMTWSESGEVSKDANVITIDNGVYVAVE